MKTKILMFLALAALMGCKKEPKPTLLDHNAIIQQYEIENRQLQETVLQHEIELKRRKIREVALVGILLFGIGLHYYRTRSRLNEIRHLAIGADASGSAVNHPGSQQNCNGTAHEDWHPCEDGGPKARCDLKRAKVPPGDEQRSPLPRNCHVLVDGEGVAIEHGSLRLERLLSLLHALQCRKLKYCVVFDRTINKRAAAVGPSQARLVATLIKGGAGECIAVPGGILQLNGSPHTLQIISNDPDLRRLLAFKQRIEEQDVTIHPVSFRHKVFSTPLLNNKHYPLLTGDEALRRLGMELHGKSAALPPPALNHAQPVAA
jgi:hypothetical protein